MGTTTLPLELLRQGRISQGRAAALLGLTRHDVLRLMGEHQIPSGPVSIEELRIDLEAAERHLRGR